MKEMNNISVVINYSTNDHKFLYHCINECLEFSDDIVVSYTTHMFNGERENFKKVHEGINRYIRNPFVYFHQYNYDHILTLNKGTRYWHNHARYTGWKQTDKDEHDYVLFLDVDEIPDGKRFNEWLSFKLDKDWYTFDGYWYFRSPLNQALTTERTSLLLKNKFFEEDIFYNPNERWGMLDGDGKNRIVGNDGNPIIHHYSWVRTKKEMLKKVQSWGHNEDRDWEELIEQEFTHDFNGTDFVHGYEYKILDEPFKEINFN